MNASQSLNQQRGVEFGIARLMELILIELLRQESPRAGKQAPGMLAGLADPLVEHALCAMHENLAHGWTVAGLARHAGISLIALAAPFREIVGTGPYRVSARLANGNCKGCNSARERNRSQISRSIT